MKHLLLIFLLVTINAISSQGQLLEDYFPLNNRGLVSYSDVVEVDSVIDKRQIYLAAKAWAAIAFVDSDEVIKVDTEDKVVFKGILRIQDNLPARWVNGDSYEFIIEMDFKNGKFRYNVSNIRFDYWTYKNSKFEDGIEKLENYMTGSKRKMALLHKYCKKVDSRFSELEMEIRYDIIETAASQDW